MSKDYYINPKDLEINYMFFEKILQATDFSKGNALDACRIVYEKTYMMYGIKYLEERYRAEDITNKMVEKVRIIDEKDTKIKELETELATIRGGVQEGSGAEAESNT